MEQELTMVAELEEEGERDGIELGGRMGGGWKRRRGEGQRGDQRGGNVHLFWHYDSLSGVDGQTLLPEKERWW
jgi:hypothetical protein